MSPTGSGSGGVVVLAAYRPDPELFRVQLTSIRQQTRGDFRCLVGADGGQAEVAVLVKDAVGDDDRFEVVGWDDNVGFYLNFERLLTAVPDDAGWVALSDHDDRWYPDKLERLVPLLDRSVLVTGQARVVSAPDGRVLLPKTDRRVVPAEDLLLQNQVSGALAVVRRELLDLALPFPQLRTLTQFHDHWLAVCAAATDRYLVLDEVVQDYVQHQGNEVGEDGGLVSWLRRATAHARASRDQGGGMTAELRRFTIGWRLTMVDALARRGVGPSWPRGSRRGRALALAMRAARSRHVSVRVALPMLAGAMLEWLARAPVSLPGDTVDGIPARAPSASDGEPRRAES